MKRLKGFTLAEVLITLAIIGVVAAISIPSVISNTQQQEFKTGLRKAVSVLNSAITMNMAIDGESPYDNANLPGYLMRHMNILKNYGSLPYRAWVNTGTGQGYVSNNKAFYTTDGMRYEFGAYNNTSVKLHESNVYPCAVNCGGCGSYGLTDNHNATTKPPCLIMVDVNGDRKPSPSNANCTLDLSGTNCYNKNWYKFPNPSLKLTTDIFSIIITENRAVPFGVIAQRAMYDAQK